MADAAIPGGLFRNNYALPPEGSQESARFRSRLYAAYRKFVRYDYDHRLADELRIATGACVGTHGAGARNFEAFFQRGETVDLLSFITIVHRYLGDYRDRAEWLTTARTIFASENILYVLDDKCGVHPKVDAEFQRNVRSALLALEAPKFRAAREAFDSAYNNLATNPPDYKGSIRGLFESAETVFRLTLDNRPLTELNIKALLVPAVDKKYAGSDPATIQSAARFVESFSRWVIAAHPYRHGHGTEIPVTPPDELALAQFAIGAGFVRWLTTI